jgi:hypothetical protein
MQKRRLQKFIINKMPKALNEIMDIFTGKFETLRYVADEESFGFQTLFPSQLVSTSQARVLISYIYVTQSASNYEGF